MSPSILNVMQELLKVKLSLVNKFHPILPSFHTIVPQGIPLDSWLGVCCQYCQCQKKDQRRLTALLPRSSHHGAFLGRKTRYFWVFCWRQINKHYFDKFIAARPVLSLWYVPVYIKLLQQAPNTLEPNIWNVLGKLRACECRDFRALTIHQILKTACLTTFTWMNLVKQHSFDFISKYILSVTTTLTIARKDSCLKGLFI